MSVYPGTVILIREDDLPEDIDHPKYALCVTNCLCFYFYINSEPRRKSQDAQVTVFGQHEVGCLKHTSYIDSSQLHQFPSNVAQRAIENGDIWKASINVLKRVREYVEKNRYLPKKQIRLVMDSLSSYI